MAELRLREQRRAARPSSRPRSQKYALACAQNRPTDVVFMQKMFFEIMKQHQGEYMGSLLSAMLESMAAYGRPDDEASREPRNETIDAGPERTR